MDLASFVALSQRPRGGPRRQRTHPDFYRKLSMQGGGFNILFVKDPDYFRSSTTRARPTRSRSSRTTTATPRACSRSASGPVTSTGARERRPHLRSAVCSSRDRKTKFDWKAMAKDLCEASQTVTEFTGARICWDRS